MSKIIIANVLYEKVSIYLLELSILKSTHRRVDHVYLNILCLRKSTNLYTIGITVKTSTRFKYAVKILLYLDFYHKR